MQPLKVEWEGKDQDRTPEQPALKWGWFGTNWRKHFLNFMIMKKNVQNICKSQLMSEDSPGKMELSEICMSSFGSLYLFSPPLLPFSFSLSCLLFSSLFLVSTREQGVTKMSAAGVIKMFKDILLELVQRNRETCL